MSSALLALAKEHFGYQPSAPDCTIPKPYLAELQKHLSQYPWDDKFTIKRQPKQGFGILTCQEEGCHIPITLTRLDGERDGGRKGGVGSLAAFRDHIEAHPSHKKSCLKRVKANEASSAVTENPALAMNARGSNLMATRLLKEEGDDSSNRRSSAPFAAGLAVPTVPRKRHSDSSLAQPSSKILAKDDSPSPPKKARQEVMDRTAVPKFPLATNKAMVNHAPAVVAPADVDDIREQLRDVMSSISKEEHQCDRAERKKHKTKGDQTRIRHSKERLAELYRRRDGLKAQIPNTSIRSRLPVQGDSALAGTNPEKVKPKEDATEGPSAIVQRPALPDIPAKTTYSRPSLGGQVKPKVEVPDLTSYLHEFEQKPKATPVQAVRNSPAARPAIKSNAQGSSSLSIVKHEARQNAAASGSGSRSSPYSMVGTKVSPSRTSVKREYIKAEIDAAPSSSKTSNSPPGIQPFPFKFESGIASRKPVTQSTPPPVASSSKVQLSPRPRQFLAKAEPGPVASTSKAVFAPLVPQPFPINNEDWDMSGSEDEDEDMEYGALFEQQNQFAATLLEKAGMEVPAPIRDSRDEDGLFHGRGRDLYVGPQAKADDINQFLLMAGNSEQFDTNVSVAEGLTKLGLKSQYDLMPGMEVALMAHQVIGVSWMVDREASKTKGGCLADDMGLGKTVQMIALMVKNRSTDPNNKINLIVAPLALLDQWKLEIETKANCDFKVLIYHGPNKPHRKSDLEQYDVVITTYSTMALEWPDYEREAKAKAKARRQKKKEGSFIVSDSEEDLQSKQSNRKNRSGLLFNMEFFRIILDEAQAIKNRTTRSSRACSELQSTYRWCLTGTPIINSLADCYAYMRFLKIRPFYDWSHFNEHISLKEKRSPALAVSRLQAILATYQLRRTKESKLDGKRLIELPEKTIELTALVFSQEELDIYKMASVEARSQATFNRYLRAGTVLKNYHEVLVLLLRLRQICSHPCLIQEDVAAFVPAEDVDHSKAEVANELTRAVKLMSPEFVADMKCRMKERIMKRMEAEKESADAALEGEDCPICFDVMSDTAVVTACKHAFCRECIVDVLDNPDVDLENDAKRTKEERPCPVCRASVSKRLLFTRSAFEPSDKELNPNAAADSEDEADSTSDEMDVDDAPAPRKGKGRAVKRQRGAYRGMLDDEYDDDEDDDLSDFIVEDGEDEDEKDIRRTLKKKHRANVIMDSDDEIDTPEVQAVLLGTKTKAQLETEALEKMPRFLPSTKMKFMMELIMKSFKERQEEKILVVSQWTACLTLVSDYLSEKGIGHVKYQGDMNRDKRAQAVKVFMSKDQAKIMLMSLKCGGVGLNLTRANNVISLDLAWSRAVESQAWDRVHRLGQTRPVKVQRVVIADTVEDRIMALQERKQSLADGSLGEGKGKKIGKLTVRELANLFGLDARGRLLEA